MFQCEQYLLDADILCRHCLGLVHGGSRHAAFQDYAALRQAVTAKLPDSVPLSHGVVLPLALSTSIVGLFEDLNLSLPSLDAEFKNETVLIWGGSSSVGSVAIQLARLAGYQVLATSSKRNFQHARDLGSAEVFDYNAPDVLEQIKGYLKGKRLAGIFDCIGEESTMRACAKMVKDVLGGGSFPTTTWPQDGLEDGVKGTLGASYSASLA
jgi:NADPH:quinone reductase-like Zn-dependent oxidoreductase